MISSGSLKLDISLGCGGLPRGRIVEISGPESSGKTTLCQHIIAEAQKAGGRCVFIDADHSLDLSYAALCGVHLNQLYLAEPKCEEQALQIIEILARTGAIAVIAVDTLSALAPQAEMAAGIGAASSGLEQRLLSLALRKLAATIEKTHTLILLTCQAYPRSDTGYSNLSYNPASLSLKLNASVRLGLQPLHPIRNIRKKGGVIGNRVRIDVKKNKLDPLFQPIEVDIMYNEGISKNGDILDLGVQLMLITRQGSVYTYRGLPLGEDREDAVDYLRENPPISCEIEQIIRQRYLPPALMPVDN